MVKAEQFKEWLKKNTTYSDAVIGDTYNVVNKS